MTAKKLTMLAWIKRHKRRLVLILIYTLGLASFALLLHIVGRIAGSDDTVFPVQAQPYHTVFDWLNYRYHSWSGRIFSEIFVYIFSQAPLYLWKLMSFALYAVTAAIIFAYWRIFATKKSTDTHKDYLMLVFALILPYAFDADVLFRGGLWVTGSMNYSWIVTFGLVALYPLLRFVILGKRPHWTMTLIGLIAGVIAASSQEQVGLVLVSLTILFSAYTIFNNLKHKVRRVPVYPLLLCVLFGAALLISLLAPGNVLRLHSETATWLPDFYTTPLLQHIDYAYRWLIDATINHMGFLLVGLWALLIALLIKKIHKDRLDKMFITLLLVICFFTLSKGFGSVSYWFDFYATWKPQLPNQLSTFALIPSSIALLSTIAAPFVLYRGQRMKAILVSVLFCAALGSMVIITFSPTMYASGTRTLYVPSIILMLICYVLLSDTLDAYKKYRHVIAGSVVAISFAGYILLVLKLIHIFG